MLPIGFGSVLVQAPKGLESKFEWTADLGGQFLEFYYEEMDREGYGSPEYAQIQRLSAAYGIPVTYHLPWHRPEDDLGRYEAPKGIERLHKMLERGFAIGARYMILHLGSYPGGSKRLDTLLRVKGMTEAMAPALAEHNAVLCLENNTSQYTPNAIGISVFEWETLFAGGMPEQIGMCLDTGHAHVNGCLPELTQVLAKSIRYIHLHDNNGVLDEHRAPGLGSIDWAEWYPMLVRLPREPWVMFEYPRSDGFTRAMYDIRAAEERAGIS